MCLGCLSLLFLTSTYFTQGTATVEVWTSPQEAVQLGQNLTLRCNVSVSSWVMLSWVRFQSDYENICVANRSRTLLMEDPGVQCEQSAQSLSLTLSNMVPSKEGLYICKIRSPQGVEMSTSNVTLQASVSNFSAWYQKAERMAKCQAMVYPWATVHWSLNSQNLTDSAQTKIHTQAQQKVFWVESTLEGLHESGNYTCSVWVPGARNYPYSRVVVVSSMWRNSQDWTVVLGVGLIMVVL